MPPQTGSSVQYSAFNNRMAAGALVLEGGRTCTMEVDGISDPESILRNRMPHCSKKDAAEEPNQANKAMKELIGRTMICRLCFDPTKPKKVDRRKWETNYHE